MWEYKIVTVLCSTDARQSDWLNSVGADGWELVAVDPKFQDYDSDYQRYTFKRSIGKDKVEQALNNAAETISTQIQREFVRQSMR